MQILKTVDDKDIIIEDYVDYLATPKNIDISTHEKVFKDLLELSKQYDIKFVGIRD